MTRKNKRIESSLADTIADPHGLVLSLIGAEVLATRREDGPLARPWRTTPGGRVPSPTTRTQGRETVNDNER